MYRAGSRALAAIDEEQVLRERQETARLLDEARHALARADRVVHKLQHVNEIYRERLMGRRNL